MKKITTRLLCASSILLFGLSSCVKDVDLSQAPEKPVKGDYFDFQTTLNCPIDIDLGLQDYTVSIEIYSENPFEENDGISTKKDIEPIYRGITDAKGILKGETTLPAYIKKAYIYSPYVGVPFIETEVTASRISAGIEDPKNRSGNTRATTSERFIFPENELYNITKATTSPYKEEMQSYFPQYFTPGVETGIPIIKETKVNLAMIGKYAPSVSNTILYYTPPDSYQVLSTTYKKLLLSLYRQVSLVEVRYNYIIGIRKPINSKINFQQELLLVGESLRVLLSKEISATPVEIITITPSMHSIPKTAMKTISTQSLFLIRPTARLP